MKTELRNGQHRSAALAERHRVQLEAETGMQVEIIERRNRHGEFSSRGQFFTFELTTPFDELLEFERYMDNYQGDLEDYEIETGGDTGEEE